MGKRNNIIKSNNRISEDFTDSEGIQDDDLLAMQIFFTPDERIRIETPLTYDDEGLELPEKEAIMNALIVLKSTLTTLSEEYIRLHGSENAGEEPESNSTVLN